MRLSTHLLVHTFWLAACILTWFATSRALENQPDSKTRSASAVPPPSPPPVKKDFRAAAADALIEEGEFAGKSIVEALGAILQNPDEELREQKFRTLLAKMTAADAPGIQKLFTDANKLGRWFIPECHAFMAQWAKIDGPSAADWAVKNYHPYESPLVQRIMGGWVRGNPQQAVDWLNTAEMPDWMHDSAMEGLVKGLAMQNIEMASDLALANLDSPAAKNMTSAILDSYVHRENGLASAEAWLKTIKSDDSALKPALFSQLMDRTLRAGDFVAGAALVARTANEPWCNSSSIRRVVKGYAEAGNISGCIEWANTLPEGVTRDVALKLAQDAAPPR